MKNWTKSLPAWYILLREAKNKHRNVKKKVTYIISYEDSLKRVEGKRMGWWWKQLWRGAGSLWRRKWQPTLVFLPGKFHGQRSLMGYSPWGCKEWDMTEHTHIHRKPFAESLTRQSHEQGEGGSDGKIWVARSSANVKWFCIHHINNSLHISRNS